MTDRPLLTADQAAELLGVSRQTLYAYVSRGLVDSLPGPGPSRARRYPRASLEALRARRTAPRAETAAREAIHWGAPVLESSLTLIEDGHCLYRDATSWRSPRRPSSRRWPRCFGPASPPGSTGSGACRQGAPEPPGR